MKKIIFILIFLLGLCSIVSGDSTRIDGYEYYDTAVLDFEGMSAPSVSSSNGARLYFDDLENKLKLSENGGSYVDISAGSVSNEAYGITWDGITTIAPSKNAVYDKIETLGAGAGDVTDVGDCTGGACLDGTSDGGTYINIYDGDSNYTQLKASNTAINPVITLPATTGTLIHTEVDPTVDTSAEIQAIIGAGVYQTSDADLTDLADGSLTGTKVGFADTDSNFTATDVQSAIEEFDDVINGGVPNSATAKVDWSELFNVPAGFADGTDDGGGGATAFDDIGDPDAATTILFDNDEVVSLSTAEDTGAFLTLLSTDVDLSGDTTLLTLSFQQATDANQYYLQCKDNLSDVPVIVASIGADGALTAGVSAVTTINTGSGAMDLGDAAVANGDTDSIPTGDQVYDFCETTQDYLKTAELSGAETDPNVNTEAEIEAITGAYFGASKVVTGGYIWVADGTDFESVPMTGEVSIASGGATTIADSVTVTGWVMGASTATTPAANDNDTSLATTAFCETTQDYLKTTENIWDNIGDATADTTLAFGAFEQDITSTLDIADHDVLTITNTDADATNDGTVLVLAHNDGADVNVYFLDTVADADGMPLHTFRLAENATVGAISMYLGATGVVFSDDADGALTITGNSAQNDESLTLNFDDTADTVVMSTGSGVTKIDYGSIGADYDSSTVTLSTVSGAIDAGGATSLEIPNGAADVALGSAGQIHLNTTDEQLSFHSAADGEISGEASISLLRHIVATFDPSGYYDQETTYRVLPLMYIGDDAPEGFTITEWKVNYVKGDPTTEIDMDLCCDTTPDFNPAAGMTVMDVMDTTTGASSADTGFDSATCANGARMYLRLGSDPTDANVVITVDIWGYNEED